MLKLFGRPLHNDVPALRMSQSVDCLPLRHDTHSHSRPHRHVGQRILYIMLAQFELSEGSSIHISVNLCPNAWKGLAEGLQDLHSPPELLGSSSNGAILRTRFVQAERTKGGNAYKLILFQLLLLCDCRLCLIFKHEPDNLSECLFRIIVGDAIFPLDDEEIGDLALVVEDWLTDCHIIVGTAQLYANKFLLTNLSPIVLISDQSSDQAVQQWHCYSKGNAAYKLFRHAIYQFYVRQKISIKHNLQA